MVEPTHAPRPVGLDIPRGIRGRKIVRLGHAAIWPQQGQIRFSTGPRYPPPAGRCCRGTTPWSDGCVAPMSAAMAATMVVVSIPWYNEGPQSNSFSSVSTRTTLGWIANGVSWRIPPSERDWARAGHRHIFEGLESPSIVVMEAGTPQICGVVATAPCQHPPTRSFLCHIPHTWRLLVNRHA